MTEPASIPSTGPHSGERLQVYGRANSSNVQKVLWCAAELGRDVDRHDVGGKFGGNNEAWYKELNPNGLIPTIVDDGFVLWESNTIVRYLASSDPGGLWPSTGRDRAEAERWMDWQITTLLPALLPAFLGLIRTPPDSRDDGLIEASRHKAGQAWAILDRALEGRRFLAGDRLTMGDIPLGVYAHWWFSMPIERPDLGRLADWYAALLERPAYRLHVAGPLS